MLHELTIGNGETV